MSKQTPFNGRTRQADGLLVQAVSPNGKYRWFVRAGMPLRAALREIAAECDRLGLKVEVVSTPTTIWRDMQGTRMVNGSGSVGTQATSPESNMLAKIGRLDLLAETCGLR